MNRIEITLPIQIEAGIHFWMDRDEWNRMSKDQKRAAIERQLDIAAIQVDRDAINYGEGTISATIYGPAPVDLQEVSVYDPKAA